MKSPERYTRQDRAFDDDTHLPKKKKWRFGIGTTSRVPGSKTLHYLIADFDDYYFNSHLRVILWGLGAENFITQKTKHGWHLYTRSTMPFNTLLQCLELIGADPAWICIGEKRGYFFLADKQEIPFPWPVEHMVIHHGKKKA